MNQKKLKQQREKERNPKKENIIEKRKQMIKLMMPNKLKEEKKIIHFETKDKTTTEKIRNILKE